MKNLKELSRVRNCKLYIGPMKIGFNDLVWYSKFLLRKTLSQRLPDSIVWRKNKIGINAPLAKWFSNSNVRNFCSEIIEGNAVKILNLSNSSNNNDRLFPKLEHNPDLCWFFINYSILMQN